MITSSIEVLAHELVVTLLNIELYPLTSDHIKGSTWNMLVELRDYYRRNDKPLAIDVQNQNLVHDGEKLVSSTLQAGRLVRLCRQRRIRTILFGEHTDAEELVRFLVLLSSPHDVEAFAPASLSASFARSGIKNIRVMVTGGPQDLPEVEEELPRQENDQPIAQYQNLTSYLQDSHVAAFRGEELSILKASDLVESAIDQMAQEPSVLLALATYDDIDSFTVGHSVRVALLALQAAQAAGASREDLTQVGTAALLHDIGKAHIPQDILFKRGPLDAEEREIMAQHPRLGGEILLEQGELDKTAIGAAFCHHMSPQGGGYPHPALPFEPSGISKLVRVCDVFEALTAVRPYKRALSPVEAYSVMLRMEKGFDPEWLRFFIQVLGLYPQGTSVTLSDGSKGIVSGQGRSLENPEVLVLVDAEGNQVPANVHKVVSAGRQKDGSSLDIVPTEEEDDVAEAVVAGHANEPTSCCGEQLVKPATRE